MDAYVVILPAVSLVVVRDLLHELLEEAVELLGRCFATAYHLDCLMRCQLELLDWAIPAERLLEFRDAAFEAFLVLGEGGFRCVEFLVGDALLQEKREQLVDRTLAYG